jgi:hypothetical protein
MAARRLGERGGDAPGHPTVRDLLGSETIAINRSIFGIRDY